MTPPLAPRSDDQWVAALRGAATADRERVLDDLARFLRGALRRILRGPVSDDDLADFTQETLLRLLTSVDSFRGESRFTTWATAVATRVAFTEMRRRGVRERGRTTFESVVESVRDGRGVGARPADEIAGRRQLLAALDRAIAEDLTERQRIAILAELRGVPTVEISERLGTNQNALYKLVHDARKKLRRSLQRAGFDATSIREEIEGGRGR